MNILVTCDSYKDCLSAKDVGKSIISGIKKSLPLAKIIHIPIADGGEGSLAAINDIKRLDARDCTSVDPLFRPISVSYLVDITSSIAYIEMAAASGLELLSKEERDCFITSTYGTGRMMADACEKGIEKIVLFIGGSATSDMGIGMAAAMGVKFANNSGNNIPYPKGCHLDEIDSINIPEHLSKMKVTVVSDVENPLFGPDGASFTYGPQKGGNKLTIPILDEGMRRLNKKLSDNFGNDYSMVPGAGAAGGIGAMCMYLFNANIVSGADFLIGILNLENYIINCDLVVTGEGKMDSQTLNGKLISKLGNLSGKHQKDMLAVCGTITIGEKDLKKMNIKNSFSLAKITQNAPYSPQTTIDNLINVGKEIGGLYS